MNELLLSWVGKPESLSGTYHFSAEHTWLTTSTCIMSIKHAHAVALTAVTEQTAGY